jgi:hypothetical protein
VSPEIAKAAPARETTKPVDSTAWLTLTGATVKRPIRKGLPSRKAASLTTGWDGLGMRVKSGQSFPLKR